MIKIEDLHKSFNGNHVLRGVNFSVKRGELIAVIGRSGYGKSVLLKHIAGLMKPDKGRIIIDGEDIKRLSHRKLLRFRNRLGYLFQSGALFDSMTVYENVAFPLREKTDLKEDEIRERVIRELEQVGLKGSEDKYPSQLSGGMIKRAALARELIWNPDIMLFDEPTTGLDPIISTTILNLIQSCHRRFNFTGIIVTHEVPKVFSIVDKVAMLHDGKIIFYGSSDGIMKSSNPIIQQFIKGSPEGPLPEFESPHELLDKRRIKKRVFE